MLVLYICKGQDIIIKNVHHAMNVTSTEAKIFTIRCSINCATQIQDVKHIIIITDAIPATKYIFNMTIHPYQLYSIAISKDLKDCFNKNSINFILFWDCPSSDKWPPHLLVDKESIHLKMNPVLPSKLSWEFSRKKEYNSVICKWQMYFQASEYKGRNFLDLNNDNNQPICPAYSKGSTWMKCIGFFSVLCARVTRLIMNHAPIREYRLKFFPKESFACSCGEYPIETWVCTV